MDLLKILNPSPPPAPPSSSPPRPHLAWTSSPLSGSGSGSGSTAGPNHQVPLSRQYPVLASSFRAPVCPTTSAAPALTNRVRFPQARCHHPKVRFLSLPGEIRNEIYRHAARYPTCQELYAGYQREVDRHLKSGRRAQNDEDTEYPPHKRRFRTPTILLLCRAITAECLPFFKSAKFVVDQLPPWGDGLLSPLKLTDFISRRTLQGMGAIEVYVPLGVGVFGGGW